jgi:hypothetical protein
VEAPLDALLAPELADRELLLFVVRLVVPLERLLLLRVPLERLDDLRPDGEPPELEPEPLLLAWGMSSSLGGRC